MSSREIFARVEAEHGEIENGLLADVATPTYLLTPENSENNIWLCTKRYFIDEFIEKALQGSRDDIWISRAGMWPGRMIDWLAAMADDKPILYLGDLDGFDIAGYWDLGRALHERGKRLRYWGVDSAWLEIASGCTVKKTLDPQIFNASRGEAALAEAMLEAYPITEKIIGASASALLRSGKKIELEALISDSFFEGEYWSRLERLVIDKTNSLVGGEGDEAGGDGEGGGFR